MYTLCSQFFVQSRAIENYCLHQDTSQQAAFDVDCALLLSIQKRFLFFRSVSDHSYWYSLSEPLFVLLLSKNAVNSPNQLQPALYDNISYFLYIKVVNFNSNKLTNK